jgi:hypothetical protein
MIANALVAMTHFTWTNSPLSGKVNGGIGAISEF